MKMSMWCNEGRGLRGSNAAVADAVVGAVGAAAAADVDLEADAEMGLGRIPRRGYRSFGMNGFEPAAEIE